MKSILLSICTVLTLSNVVSSVTNENIRRLITNNNRVLLESACPTINECQLASDGITYEQYTCNGGSNELVRKEYSQQPCTTANKIPGSKTKGPYEDPCCVNYCPPETKAKIGVCEPTGRNEPLDPYDPESEWAPTYRIFFCNEDGTGEAYTSPYTCDPKNRLTSSIGYTPCCPQPTTTTSTTTSTTTTSTTTTKPSTTTTSTTTTTTPPSCYIGLNKCLRPSRGGSSLRYYCEHGKGLTIDYWKETTDCSGEFQTHNIGVHDCCRPSCDGIFELNTCNGRGVRYQCTSEGGLHCEVWDGEDCSGGFRTLLLERYYCCLQPACYGDIELNTCINESGSSKRYYCVDDELTLDSWDGTDCSGQLTTIPQETGNCCEY